MMYESDGVNPVAVLDGKACIAPRPRCRLDVFHAHVLRVVLQKYGVDTMPSMLRPEDVREQYGEASGVDAATCASRWSTTPFVTPRS